MVAKLKINIETGEIMIEGSEEFVNEKIENLEDIIGLITQLQTFDYDEDINTILEEKTKVEEERISSVGETGLEILTLPPLFWTRKGYVFLTDDF